LKLCSCFLTVFSSQPSLVAYIFVLPVTATNAIDHDKKCSINNNLELSCKGASTVRTGIRTRDREMEGVDESTELRWPHS